MEVGTETGEKIEATVRRQHLPPLPRPDDKIVGGKIGKPFSPLAAKIK